MDVLNPKLFVGLFFLLSSSISHSVTIPPEKNQPTPIVSSSPWHLEFGSRYWRGTGKYTKNLFNDMNALVSRLTYNRLTSNSAEGFWQLNHDSGVFLKGYVGGGSINSGQLTDEDFPPGIIYSRTNSEQKNGALNYLSVDLGYHFFTNQRWQIGGFAGYHYWMEQYNAFGCTQTATNGTVCTSTPLIPEQVDALNNNAIWNSLRLGLNATLELTERLNLTTDIAYVRSNLTAHDFHNLRPSIRGLLENGSGNGTQLDAILNWKLTRDLGIGVGGRWWRVATSGYSHFEEVDASGQPQPMNVTQDSYGLLLQANYKFDDTPLFSTLRMKEPENPSAFYWPGSYVGMNLGYGTNPSTVHIYPTSTLVANIQDNSPIALYLQNAGFLAGGQLGYNWQINAILLGIEGDLNYPHISSANAVTLNNAGSLTTTVNQNIEWISTLRARLGKLATNNMLVYLTAGPAFGGTNLAFDQRQIEVSCTTTPCSTANATQNKLGWAAGGGIEYAVNQRATFKAEYLYMDLGYMNINVPSNTTPSTMNYQINSSFNNNILRLGVNYKLWA
jgi:opacity protein-like surface antigen